MIPPTSIDGTDITGATIDGTDVQEITVDGDVVFSAAPPIPTSTFLQYDASALTGLSNNDVVNTLTDNVGSNDASANQSPIYLQNEFNGLPIVRYGLNDTHLTTFSVVNQPFTAITVFKNFNYTGSGTNRVWTRPSFGQQDTNLSRTSSGYTMYAGNPGEVSSTRTDTSGIFACIFDGTNSELRINGSTVATGDVGNNTLGGIELAGQTFENIFFASYDLAEHLFYDEDLRSTNELAQEESRLSSKWGITI